jgi:uncharacterized protein YrrD
VHKYSEVTGLPVIAIDTGKKVGTVRDILFCTGEKLVKGFLLERKGYEIEERAVMLRDVVSLGSGAVVVNDRSCILSVKKLAIAEGLKDIGAVKGLKIYTRSGKDLGVVKDALFDCKTGRLEGVEVSDGVLNDLVEGRNIIPLFGKVEFSEEIILVDREAAEEMTSTGGGIKKLFGRV